MSPGILERKTEVGEIGVCRLIGLCSNIAGMDLLLEQAFALVAAHSSHNAHAFFADITGSSDGSSQ